MRLNLSNLFCHSRESGNLISRLLKIPACAGMTILLFAAPAHAVERYEFEKSHTNILFFVNHMGFSEMVGRFTDYDGYFLFDDKNPATGGMVDITLKPSGIKTSSEALDDHLQKPEFFNTEKFPELRFVSTHVKITGKNTANVTGNLTMLGVTKPVTLRVTLKKADVRPMMQDFAAGFIAEAKIKRSDFGMTNGIPMVGDDVRLWVSTEGVNVDRKKK